MTGSRCTCTPKDRLVWRVVQYRQNRSAFNGYHPTRSEYSEIRCLRCGGYWRTKAKYVEEIAIAEDQECVQLPEDYGGPKARSLTSDEQNRRR